MQQASKLAAKTFPSNGNHSRDLRAGSAGSASSHITEAPGVISNPEANSRDPDYLKELNDVIDALALLGIKRCAHCRKFFSVINPGNFFGKNELVCYGCIPDWWSSRSGEIEVRRREKLETMLESWLRSYHGARIVKEEHGKMPEIASTEFRIVVHCNECGGSGTMLAYERCRFCNGFGTVWVVSTRLAPSTFK